MICPNCSYKTLFLDYAMCPKCGWTYSQDGLNVRETQVGEAPSCGEMHGDSVTVDLATERIPLRVKRFIGVPSPPARIRAAGDLLIGTRVLAVRVTRELPGSDWIVLGLAVVTSILLAIFVPNSHVSIGAAFGVAWSVWFSIIKFNRWRQVRIDLMNESVKEAILDFENSRVAIRTSTDGRDGWIGFVLVNMPRELLQRLSINNQAAVREGSLKEDQRAGIVLLALLSAILAMLLLLLMLPR